MLSMFVCICSYAVFVPCNVCVYATYWSLLCSNVFSIPILDAPTNLTISASVILAAAKFSSACCIPTTAGLKLSLACVDKLNNVDDNCEPATSAELNLGPTVSIAAANSVYDIPAEDAAVPDFSNAVFKY